MFMKLVICHDHLRLICGGVCREQRCCVVVQLNGRIVKVFVQAVCVSILITKGWWVEVFEDV